MAARYPELQFLATSSTIPVDLRNLQVKIFVSLFGFFAVAYLASYLAESLRKTGAELRDKSGQVASLQAINENIIQSMRDGLITTDLDGTIPDLNPAGAAILGRRPWDLKGRPIAEVFPEAAPGETAGGDGSAAPPRREITYGHPRGERRILAVASSPLVVPDAGALGLVYNFQDLTEEKRLEAEYRAKDRMATLGTTGGGHRARNSQSAGLDRRVGQIAAQHRPAGRRSAETD